MDPSIAKKTQDTLGKVIKKPPLTEKLLSKPPFRFLHDVVTSVIKTTGFMQGLFTDSEMNSENVKDKDSKVAFLQKVVDIIVAATGKSVNVRPIKIVAGHEPERTNELLQALATAINKNVDNDEYVRRVLKGDSGGSGSKGDKDDKKEKQSKDRTKSADRRKNESDNKADKEKDGDKGKEKGDRERQSERGKSRGGERHRDNERESKTRDRSRDGRDERHRDKSRKSYPPDVESKASSSSGRKSLSGLSTTQKKYPSNSTDRLVGAKSKLTATPKSATGTSKIAGLDRSGLNGRKVKSVQGSGAASASLPYSTGRTRRGVLSNPCGDSPDSRLSCACGEDLVEVSDGNVLGNDVDLKSQGDGLMISTTSLDSKKETGSTQANDEQCRDESKEKENESPSKQNGEEDRQEPPPRLQRPSSAKGSRRRREGEQNGEVSEEEEEEERGDGEERGVEESVIYSRHKPASEDEEFQKEMAPSKDAVIGDGDLPPQIAAARQLARPSSARPAPPRPKQEASESEPAMRLGGGQPTNVIVDNANDDEDDDENFLVEESAPPPPDLEPQPISKPAEEDDAEHGALVKKMLESKKELEGGSQTQQAAQAKKTEIERPTMSDAQRRKQREQVQKEVEKLRGSIQSLTRSANPLGKVMDYVQEDLDSMQQELDKWKQENAQLGLDLKREMNVTDRAVEPLKQQLAELEQAIGDQLDQIAATKCKIIKNDSKMEKMLKSIAKS